MKNKRKLNKAFLLSLIFILVCGFLSSFVGKSVVSAKDNAEGDGLNCEEEKGSENSGGFVIETEKVEGEMNPADALLGKVDIKEGVIHGLTITKTLDRGEGQEPLIIKIKSPGPIPVKSLKACTLGGAPPTIGGLCIPSEVGWVCLSNVSMTVTAQTVETIELPDATIETCIESECEDVANENSLSSKKVQSMLKKMEKKELTLQEIKDGLVEDEKQLKNIGDRLDQATATYKKVGSDNQLEELEKNIESVKKLLAEEVKVTKENPTEKAEGSKKEETTTEDKKPNDETVEPKESNFEKMDDLTKSIGEMYESTGKISSDLTKELDEVFKLMKEFEENILVKEKAIKTFVKKEQNQAKSEKQQAKAYSSLQETAEDTNKEEEIKIEDLQKKLDKIKDEMKSVNKDAEELRDKEKALLERIKLVTDNITDLKSNIIDLRTKINELDPENVVFPKGFVETLLKYLDEVQVKEDTEEDKSTDEKSGENEKEQGDKEAVEEVPNGNQTVEEEVKEKTKAEEEAENGKKNDENTQKGEPDDSLDNQGKPNDSSKDVKDDGSKSTEPDGNTEEHSKTESTEGVVKDKIGDIVDKVIPKENTS